MQVGRVAAVADNWATEPLLPPPGRPPPPPFGGLLLGAHLDGDGGAGVIGGVAEVPRDALGRLVLGVLHTTLPGTLRDLGSPRVAGLIRQLRQRVTIMICCTVLTAAVAVWLLVHGVATYIAIDAPGCGGPMRIWLPGFLMLQLAWPICTPSLTLLLLGWCLGALMLLHEPRHCEQIHEFLIEASLLQTVQTVLLGTATLAAVSARPLIQQLNDFISHSGTDPEVQRHIVTVPPDDVPTDAECVICLSREDEDGVPWRRLACGHLFHEPCLLVWLEKARRCPVCRLDLHLAYSRAVGTAVDAGA